jgi:hypothetical protein
MRYLFLLVPALAASQDKEMDPRIDAFAAKVVAGTDETAVRFRKAIQTPAGKIVLRDRIEKAAESLRRRSEKDALPDFFKARFEEAGGKLRLRAGQEDFRRRLVDGYALYQADLAKIEPLVRQVARNVADEPEINAKIKRLLSHEAAAHLFYNGEIRRRIRPDVYLFQKELGGILAMAEDGRFYVPESRQETARQYARFGGAIVEAVDRVSAELKKIGSSLAPLDDFHKRLKEASADPLFAGVLLEKSVKGDSEDIEASVQKVRGAADEFARRLPEVFLDTPKGKVLVEDKVDGVQELLRKYDQVRGKVAVLREPAREFAGRLREGDDLADGFRKMLHCDIVLTLLDHVGENLADPVEALNALLARALVKDEKGVYRVPPEKAEEIAREIKNPDQVLRKEESGLRLLSMYGEQVEDPELRKVFTSYYGKYEVEQQVKGALAVRTYDGLGAWIGEHFEKSESGFRLRAASRKEIEAILSEVERLEKEGKKDDLKD